MIALIVVWGLLFAAEMPIRQAYINGMIPSKQRATILSFDSLMGSSGGVWAQPVLGRSADVWGYAPSYLFSAGIAALALPFIWLSRRERNPADTGVGAPAPEPEAAPGASRHGRRPRGRRPTADLRQATPPRPRSAPLDHLVELLDHVGVAQRGHVAELAALGDVAQQPAHDLARAGLRQVVGPDDPLRARELADPLGDVLADLGDSSSVPSCSPWRVTKAQIDWPVSSSAWPITAASATFGCETIADSTSAVESRWPETLITSSTRPMTQK